MDGVPESRPSLDPLYLSHYLEVLRDAQAHLSGRTPDEPLPPSLIPPTGYWSTHEKNAFFHALCVHSRLRPDLIADSVKTKSITDVCNYIDLMDESLRNTEGARLERKEIPAAMELVPDWLAFEEQQAVAILAEEPGWDLKVLQQDRDAGLTARKKLVRGHKMKAGMETEQRDLWTKEDSLQSLDRRDMVALGMILRAAEAPPDDESRSGSRSRQSTDPREISPPLLPTPGLDESLIDPALLALRPPLIRTRSPSPTSNTSIPPDLSPVSRRRFQKRLYMRRKRAKVAGREAELKVARLKPGRRAKKVRGASINEDVVMSGADEDEFRHDQVSGKTAVYKSLAKFTDVGIDANLLGELGLDLFHLGGLSKLINLYGMLHEDGSTVATHISYETIQLIRAHVIRFVTDLVHRTILVREQELRSKSHTKVWKISDAQLITTENVNMALEIVSAEQNNKAAHFSQLAQRLEAERSSDEDGDSDSDLSSDSESSPRAKSPKYDRDSPTQQPIFRLPTHQAIYAPFIRLPLSYTEYDTLIPSDSDDQDELMTELQQETELDGLDNLVESMHQKALWERFSLHRRNRPPPLTSRRAKRPDDDGYVSDGDGEWRAAKMSVKSKAYISDSD